MIRHLALTMAGIFCIAGSAQAHITLEQAEVVSGNAYEAVLRVLHGF